MAQVLGPLAMQLKPAAERFPALGPTQRWCLHFTQYLDLWGIPRFAICCPKNPKKSTQHGASLFVAGDERCNSFPLTLDGLFQQASWECYSLGRFFTFEEWSHPLECLCLSKTSTFTQSNQHMSSTEGISVTSCECPASPGLFRLWSQKRAEELHSPGGKTVHLYYCPFQPGGELLLMCFLTGMEKNTLARSVAARHAPRTGLIYPCKDTTCGTAAAFRLLFGWVCSSPLSSLKVCLILTGDRLMN